MKEGTSGPTDRAAWHERVDKCLTAVQAFREQPPEVRCAADLAAAEREDARLCDELHAALMAELTQAALDKPALQEQAQTLARSAPKRLKAAGEREVHVQFQRGPEAPLRAVYYRRRPCDAFHREKGLFPAFVLLGIQYHPIGCDFRRKVF